MLWIAWDSQMSKLAEDGSTTRAHLEASARGGNRVSAKALIPPAEYPDCLDYLYAHFLTLQGMRRVNVAGIVPLTPETLDAANRAFDWRLSESEMIALHQFDVAFRNPDATLASVAEEAEPVRVERAWPTRKVVADG